MDFSFQRYLISKRTVDDRALNRLVWKTLMERVAALKGLPFLQVLDIGGGVGTMFERLVEWGLLNRAEYTLLDEQAANVTQAREHLASWAQRQSLTHDERGETLVMLGENANFRIECLAEEMYAFLGANPARRWDLITAHAFLDLVNVETALPLLKNALRGGGLMYLTLVFDGLTAFEPPVDPDLDERIIQAYHRTMDERGRGGSRSGRGLFTALRQAGLNILEAGSSDWIVSARGGRYPADEAYFLGCILHFFNQSLQNRPELAGGELASWLAARRKQIGQGELVYMAHQYDFLVEAD